MRQCKVYVHNAEAGTLTETDAREYVGNYGMSGKDKRDMQNVWQNPSAFSKKKPPATKL